jgi:HSP20 family protein
MRVQASKIKEVNMALIRYYDPFKDFEDLFKAFDKQLSTVAQPALTTPVADVYTEDGVLHVEAHLPNFKKEEINVDVHEGALEISAQHAEKDEDKKNRKYVLRESSTSFYRRVGLPKNVDGAKVKADFNDGVLKVSVPFKDLPKPKRVAIGGKK